MGGEVGQDSERVDRSGAGEDGAGGAGLWGGGCGECPGEGMVVRRGLRVWKWAERHALHCVALADMVFPISEYLDA